MSKAVYNALAACGKVKTTEDFKLQMAQNEKRKAEETAALFGWIDKNGGHRDNVTAIDNDNKTEMNNFNTYLQVDDYNCKTRMLFSVGINPDLLTQKVTQNIDMTINGKYIKMTNAGSAYEGGFQVPLFEAASSTDQKYIVDTFLNSSAVQFNYSKYKERVKRSVSAMGFTKVFRSSIAKCKS